MLDKEVFLLILIGIVIYLIYMKDGSNNSKKIMPTTRMPTTRMPTTRMPTTSMPTTSMPTTSMPTTSMPTTSMPTRQMPTGQMPTGQMPSSQMQLPSLENMPTSIKNIITEIGQNQATPAQLKRLEKAVKDTIKESKTTALKIVNDVKNAPMDTFGKPILDKKILSLYMLMLMLFMGSEGKYFKNEIGPEIEKSYGSMPTKKNF
jgi:hypothetical protein